MKARCLDPRLLMAAVGIVLMVGWTACQPASRPLMLAPGDQLPELEVGEWLNGDPGDLAGKVVVVDAFFTM